MPRDLHGRRAVVADAFSRQYDGLCRLAYLLTGDRSVAEEIVMDVFTDTLRSWRPLPGSLDIVHYLRRAVVNRSRSAGRRRTRDAATVSALASLPPAAAPTPNVETKTLVAAAVLTLPPRQRAVVVLTYFLDLPVNEVARSLGCSTGTVKSQLFKARAALAAALPHGATHD